MTAFILTSVSWGQFLIYFVIATLVWIGWVYKDVLLGKGPPLNESSPDKKKIWQVNEVAAVNDKKESDLGITSRQPVAFNTLDFNQEHEPDAGQVEQDGNDDFGQMEELIISIEQIITNNQNAGKQIILDELKPALEKYSGLNHPPFKIAIHNFIIRFILKEAGIPLSEGEVDNLWP